MAWSAENGARSNFGAANYQHGNPPYELLNPSPLLNSDIGGLAASEAAGRPTWRLTATPRRGEAADRWPWEHCVDDYSVEVDREFGLVLQLAGRVDRRDAVRYWFEDLILGAQLDDDLFEMVAPDGSDVKDARSSE